MEVRHALAHRLRRRRMALGLSLTSLSEQTQIPIQVLSRLEHGRQSLYIERLAELARFLGVSTDFLLGLSDIDVLPRLKSREDVKNAPPLPEGCTCTRAATETPGLLQDVWDAACPVHRLD